MRRIIAGTLALTVLSSTWLLGSEGATKAKKATKKAPPVSAQMQQMQDQLNQQQQQINQLQQQLQQSNQQLQSTQSQLQSSVQKANQDAASAQQSASAAQQTANSLSSSVADLKTCCSTLTESVATLKKEVKDLENPLAIRYKGVKITPMGFMDGAMYYRQKAQGATSTTNYATTQLNGTTAASLNEFRMSSQNSQIGLLAQGDAGKAKLTGFWQIDFNGAQSVTATNATGSNQNINLPGIVNSNNFYPRLRHMFGQVEMQNGWSFMGGQSWFLGTMNRKGIDPLNVWYPVGDDNQTIVGFSEPNRTVQFRLTKNFWDKKAAFAISADGTDLKYVNDGTTPANVVGQSAASLNQVYAPDPLPDFWVKLALDPGWGHYEFKGVARFFRDRVLSNYAGATLGTGTGATQTSHGTNNYTEGWGLGFGTILPVTKKVDFIFNGLAGAGIGTYLGTTEQDVTLNYSQELVPIKSVGVTSGLEFHPMPKFDANFYYSEEYFERAQYNVGTTKGGFGSIYAAPGTDNKSVQWAMASFVYRWYRGPFGTFQTMVQPMWYMRTTWAGTGNSASGISYASNNGTAKGSNFVGIVSMRYILP